jgi:hypothetical protein
VKGASAKQCTTSALPLPRSENQAMHPHSPQASIHTLSPFYYVQGVPSPLPHFSHNLLSVPTLCSLTLSLQPPPHLAPRIPGVVVVGVFQPSGRLHKQTSHVVVVASLHKQASETVSEIPSSLILLPMVTTSAASSPRINVRLDVLDILHQHHVFHYSILQSHSSQATCLRCAFLF